MESSAVGLAVVGAKVKVRRGRDVGAEALLPWDGRDDTLIDRFDARANATSLDLGAGDDGGAEARCDWADAGGAPDRVRRGLSAALVDYERYRSLLHAARHRVGNLSSSVTSKSFGLIFGRIVFSRRVLEVRQKSPVHSVQLRTH